MLKGHSHGVPHSGASRLWFEAIFEEVEDPRLERVYRRIAEAIQNIDEEDKLKEVSERYERDRSKLNQRLVNPRRQI